MELYGNVDSKFRFVIVAAKRAKQIIKGAKPKISLKSRNAIRIAQAEVRSGLIDFQVLHNVKEDYIPAWLNLIAEGPFKGELDLAVITTPDSRLNNFYIGGLDWMLKHIGLDGVYIDDSALDRETVRRARKLIDHYRPQGRIDFHSWNHFNAMAGFTNCLNLYMDLLPYFDLVWIGEQRDYSEKVAQEIDEEVRKIINAAYERAKEVLLANKDRLIAIAQALIEKETLGEKEFEAFFQTEPAAS